MTINMRMAVRGSEITFTGEDEAAKPISCTLNWQLTHYLEQRWDKYRFGQEPRAFVEGKDGMRIIDENIVGSSVKELNWLTRDTTHPKIKRGTKLLYKSGCITLSFPGPVLEDPYTVTLDEAFTRYIRECWAKNKNIIDSLDDKLSPEITQEITNNIPMIRETVTNFARITSANANVTVPWAEGRPSWSARGR